MRNAHRYPLMRNNILREDLDAIIAHLSQDEPMLTQSEQVRAFEREWSEWLGVRHSVFVNSGASANLLTLALLKLRFPQGGEVIVPTLTWVSDIAAVIQNGFEPVFVDINPRTLSMASEQVIPRLNARTRAVFLTHAQGFNGLTNELLAALRQHDVLLIEDVCESHGAQMEGAKLGSLSWISNFSFYYAHHMSTIEGGMICTNDPLVYQQARMLRSHGMVREADDPVFKHDWQERFPELNPDFIFSYPSFNVRNTEIGGILGRSQLKRLDGNILLRNRNHSAFLDALDHRNFRTDFELDGSSNYAFNVILTEPDTQFMERVTNEMRKVGIEFRRGSAGGGNQLRQPYLRDRISPRFWEQFPQVEHVHFFGFYIGNFPDLSLPEVAELARTLNSV